MSFDFEGEHLSALKKYAGNSDDLIWFITSKDFLILECSKRFLEITGQKADKPVRLNDLITEQCAENLIIITDGTKTQTLDFNRADGIGFSLKCTFESTENGYLVFGNKFTVTGDELLMSMTKLNNELSSALRELDRKNKEIEEAKKKIKVLSGLLPVCSYCKKIRSEDQSWTQLESYIDKHSEAEFSHTICPSCMDKYFPE